MRYRLTLTLIASLSCLVGLRVGLLAAEPSGKLPPEAMAGQVVDPSGKPAAGATVWLVGGPHDEDARVLSTTTSNADGRFVFPDAKVLRAPEKGRVPTALARTSRGQLAWDSYPWAWSSERMPRRDLRLKLCEVRDYSARLLIAASREKALPDAYGGLPAAAGFLAIQARQIGYPDMQSVVCRVLACRPTTKHASPDDLMTMATFLALVDPQTAREILESVEVRYPGVGQPARLKAWLLADGPHGETVFNEALAAIKGKPDTDDEFYRLVEAVNLLAAPHSEKAQYIAPYAHYRRPNDEW